MNPPPPGPVSGLSVTQETNAAAMQASTALPPARSTSAPASAVRGCPAAIAPFIDRRVARSEEHTSELQSHSDLHSFPTRRSSDLAGVDRVTARAQHVRARLGG